MAAPVAGQEHGGSRPDPAEVKPVRRVAPRRRHPFLAVVFESRQFIDARSADDSDDCFCHASSLFLSAAVFTWRAGAPEKRSAGGRLLPRKPSRPCDLSCPRPRPKCSRSCNKSGTLLVFPGGKLSKDKHHVDTPPEGLENRRKRGHARTCVFQAPGRFESSGHFAGRGRFGHWLLHRRTH